MNIYAVYYLEDKNTLVSDGMGYMKIDSRQTLENQKKQAQEQGKLLSGYYMARWYKLIKAPAGANSHIPNVSRMEDVSELLPIDKK